MTLDDCGDSNLALYKKPPCTIYALTGSEPLVYFMIFSDQVLIQYPPANMHKKNDFSLFLSPEGYLMKKRLTANA